jgi:hypothetical protein
MFTDESLFNRDGVNNTHNSHVWADGNPHANMKSNFQQHFSVNDHKDLGNHLLQ